MILVAGMLAILLAAPARAQPVTYQGERAAHPRMAEAIDQMKAIERELAAAPDDFGGHKATAVREVHHALIAMKRALYYRMKVDDRALEQAP
jgi:hypothetical protein